MKKQKILLSVLLIFVLLIIAGCHHNIKTGSFQNDTSSFNQPHITDSKTVIGLGCLGGLDTESFDFSACLLEIVGDCIKTADVLYDGDESSQFPITEYGISKNTKFFQKSVNTTINSKNYTSVTKEEYSVLSYKEFESLINSKVYLITANIWLDSNGSCSRFLIYRETTVWE